MNQENQNTKIRLPRQPFFSFVSVHHLLESQVKNITDATRAKLNIKSNRESTTAVRKGSKATREELEGTGRIVEEDHPIIEPATEPIVENVDDDVAAETGEEYLEYFNEEEAESPNHPIIEPATQPIVHKLYAKR